MKSKDKKEWLRWINRPPKKEKKTTSEEPPVEKIYLSGDHDLFVELCAAEETIKKLRLENKSLKEKYEQTTGRYGSYNTFSYGSLRDLTTEWTTSTATVTNTTGAGGTGTDGGWR